MRAAAELLVRYAISVQLSGASTSSSGGPTPTREELHLMFDPLLAPLAELRDQDVGGRVDVIDDREATRYEIRVDGELRGFADYRRRDGSVELHHTVIDPDARGQGLAATLTAVALDDARSEGRTVVPSCWYVRRFIDTHTEYQDLLRSTPRG